MPAAAPMPEIAGLAENLVLGPDGVWVSRTQTGISYPEEGNLNCLALEAGSFWFAHRSRCIEAVVRRLPPPGMLFDVGGGNGYVAMGLRQAGFDVALVEPGRKGVENARTRGVSPLVCSTLEDAGFRPASLPAVGIFDVLEHMAADEDFLRTLHRLIAPGGRLYLTVPAFQALWSADDDYAGHHRRYTLAGLRERLGQAGFRVEYASYIFFFLPPPIFLFRSIPSKLGLRKQEEWDRYQQEHEAKPGAAGKILERVLAWELARVRAGRTLPFGGSCLIAAQKV